nr:MAG TPA: protein of unknown function (DUF4767) [Caudoviricetes sp.]
MMDNKDSYFFCFHAGKKINLILFMQCVIL